MSEWLIVSSATEGGEISPFHVSVLTKRNGVVGTITSRNTQAVSILQDLHGMWGIFLNRSKFASIHSSHVALDEEQYHVVMQVLAYPCERIFSP